MLREAHPSIPIRQCRWTVAPFLQPSLSASFAILLLLPLQECDSLQPGLAVEGTFDYYLLEKRMLLEVEAAARECTLQMPSSARPTPASAEPQLARKSAGCARKAAPQCHACPRNPPFRVHCVEDAVAAVPPRAGSDCACQPVMPDNQICTPVVGPPGPLL